MPSIDVSSAPARFLTMSVDGYAPGRNHPGQCARWNYFALNAIPNVTGLPSAIAAWENAPASSRHALGASEIVPGGLIGALGAAPGPRWAGDENYAYGDVFMFLGDGAGLDSRLRATDGLEGVGIIGDMTVRERIAQTGRPLLGVLESYGGWTLTTTGGSAGSTTNPTQEDDMTPTQAQQLKVVFDATTKTANGTKAELEAFYTGRINAIYEGRLGRAADANGIATFLPYLMSGLSESAVDKAVMASAEFKSKHPSK